MAPEQARGEEVDHRTDLWSLGVVLYELVAGRAPFRGDYPQAVVYGILNEEPVPLAKLGIDAPAALQDILAKCLAKRAGRAIRIRGRAGAGAGGVPGPRTERDGAGGGAARPVRRRWPVGGAVAALLILGVVGVLAWWNGWGPFPASERAIRLAVLPLANLSGDPEQEYLSDGLTQELINQLGRLHPQTLSVIARTSVMQYKKSEKPMEQIGRELGVDYVLEGSAQREGGRVRITAELIRVGDQAQLWAEGSSGRWRGSWRCKATWRGRWPDRWRSSCCPRSRRGWPMPRRSIPKPTTLASRARSLVQIHPAGPRRCRSSTSSWR